MSLISSAGANAAATRILSFIQEKIAENSDNEEVNRMLREVEVKVIEVKRTAELGFF